MANQMPIYSQVVPKSQQGHNANFSRSSKSGNANRVYSSLRGDARQPHQLFDPLNYNQGGNFHLMSQPKDTRYAALPSERIVQEKPVERRESGRRVAGSGHQSSRRGQHGQGSVVTGEGKVEAYLRQNQVSIRQHQYRHSSGVRQAEHRVNLRSLPLNEMVAPRAHHTPHERTPTDHHRQFPEHVRHHRDRDGYGYQQDANALQSPVAASMRKSTSGNRVSSSETGQPTLNGDKRKFYCREWAFQKLAHCLEQRPVSKTCGALILGDAGSGKTALCKELSQPGPGPQARQQRALNRRLLARHFLQGQNENSLSMGELIRSVVMQILSHSTQHQTGTLALGLLNSPSEDKMSSGKDCNSPGDEELAGRLQEGQLCDDNEESSKPLLQDSEETRTDNEEESGIGRRHRRTMQRIHERDKYDDLLAGNEVPNVLPKMLSTNPFLNSDDQTEDVHYRLYENHENIFLRNISHRQSKEIRNPRLLRQSSEPLADKKVAVLQKSLSTENKSKSEGEQQNEQEQKEEKIKNADSVMSPNENLSPSNASKVSRIPVANFRYPNRSGVSHSSSDNSPAKTKNSTNFDRNSPEIRKNDENITRESPKPEMEIVVDETPEYQNIFKPKNLTNEFETLQIIQSPDCENAPSDKKWNEEVPPPIPSLPISPRTLIANAYYEKLLGEPEIQQALLPHNLEKNPDDCFKKALLFPLLEIDPPKQCLFLLVDSIDEASLTGNGQASTLPREGEKKPSEGERNVNSSKTVAELLANHHHLFPQWLLLVCTARKQSKSLTKMFTGFRKISLDELSRGHVSADVQRYVLARLDAEPRLRARVSADTTAAAAAAAALDHMRIKSDGCLLYLEKVLDGVADGFIALREIKEIPGTLNGLYLWLAQRLFHGRRFAKLRPLLDVLLAAKCGVTEEMLYKCLLTTNYAITRDDFNKRLHLLRRILVVEGSSGCLSVFHHSFASWLLDVKHCTRRYLCSPADGHAALAMYYTLEAKRLTALEIHNYVLHMTRLEQHILALQNSQNAWKGDSNDENIVDVHTQILLWIIDSGCSVETALHHSMGRKEDEEMDGLVSSLYGRRLPRDTRVLRALLEVGAHVESGPLLPSDEAPSEDAQPPIADVTASQLSLERQLVWEARRGPPPEPPAPEVAAPDPLTGRTAAHELAQRDDARGLEALLQRYPQLSHAADACGATALHAAARHGAAAAARVLLMAGASPDAADADGWTPLRAAAWGGHADVVEVLLEFGCQVDCVDADNRTALRAASWSGHDAVVRVLLAAGASADLADAEGRTPLIAAAYMGHADIVARLIDAGANVDHADHDGRTALSVAALCAPAAGGGCARAAQLLLERGADVKLADKDGATPLLVAAFEGHKEICELLLECDADAEACDAAGRTPLWAAAAAGHADAVRALLFWGCCVDSMDAEGRTVLSVAAAQGNVEVVRQLLDRGLDEHHRDNSGWTPLHYAAFEGHVEVCEALLEAGAKVDESDNDGKGALMLAAQEGHTRLIEVLIDDWGAPVDQHAHDGKTALRLAALEGHVDAVRALAERGAEVDALDADRRSTLYVLALDNRIAMARYLLQRCHAAVDSRDTEGRTPLHVSAWQGHQDMVNLLITVGGAEVDARDRESRTALHAAAWRGRAGCVRALLQHGADPAARCSQGATPLGIAAQEGHEECVMWLLQHGADPLQPDHCGRTPGKVALRAGHASVCRLLERWAGRPDAPSAPCAPPLDMDAATNTSGSTAETKVCTAMLNMNRLSPLPGHSQGSPDCKRRSIHSSNSTKSSSNLTNSTKSSHHDMLQHNTVIECTPPLQEHTTDKSRAGLALSFAAQVARCGRGAGWRARNQRPASPLYASPPHSPLSDVCSPTQPQAGLHSAEPPSVVSSVVTDHHFNRDTHMRIILGRDSKSRQPPISETRERSGGAYRRLFGTLGRVARKRKMKQQSVGKTKRNGIVTNPAMRLVANVRNGLDSAAANIRRTGVALAASASSANPAVKTNAFQWRRETPL